MKIIGMRVFHLLKYPVRNFVCVVKIFIVLLVCSFQVTAKGFAQKVTLNVHNEKLSAVFKLIEKQTGYRFAYSNQEVPANKEVSLQVKEETLPNVLNSLLKNLSLQYREEPGHLILIYPAASAGTSLAQTSNAGNASDDGGKLNIRGGVVNSKGEPISGASVQIQSTHKGTLTDESGSFSFPQLGDDAVLIISALGYVTREYKISGLPKNISRDKPYYITIPLQAGDASRLDEVVVIGYGTATRRKNTGSVGSISAEELHSQPVSNPLNALPGRIPGMVVTQNNGLPGSNTVVQIRGQSSLSNGNIPLYVVDGVPFTNFNGGQPATDNLNAFGISGASGGISPFSMINPADIERIDVLKDADATAIYGARGANGVILITTRKGKAGKTKVDLNVYSGAGKVARFIPMLNTQQYLALRKEAFKNDSIAPNASNAPDLTVWDQNAYTDWQKYLLGGTAHVTDAEGTLSGGDARTHFLFNTGYRKEGTVYPGDQGNSRVTARLNLDHSTADRRFNASFNVSYAQDKTNMVSNDLTTSYILPPNYPLYTSTGQLNWAGGFTNPLANLQKRYNGKTSNLISNAVLRYTVVKGLTLKTNLGYTTTRLDQNAVNPASSQNPVNNPTSSARFANAKAENYIIEPTADYVLPIGRSKLSALVGGSWQRNSSESTSLTGSNYSSDALLGSLVGAGQITLNSSNTSIYKYASLFGRINYDLKGKYILNATFRRDASSRFGPDNRFANFAAAGAAWIFSEESFVKEQVPFLSFGKLRASYGTTGNDQIPNYIYLPLYSTVSTPYQGTTGVYQPTLPNSAIQWETTRKLELAMELGFLKDHILLTANYYRNRSGNQLTYLSLPTQSGYNSYTANVPALIQNSGLELDITTTNIDTKHFKWTSSFNITFPSNELLKWPGLAQSFYSSSYIIGQPINFTKLYHYLGINPATGVAQYEDLNKDGLIDYTNDRVLMPIGTPYYGGLYNTISYKNWQCSFFIQFNHRMGYVNSVNSPVGSLNNQNTSVLDRWQQAGDQAPYPGATATAGKPIYNSYNYYTSSSVFWGDASYIKFRSANISYSLPQQWIGKLKMSSCRIYVEGQNLFSWMKNKYTFDTETSIAGGPSGPGTGQYPVLPPLRTIVLGVNLSF